MNRALHAKLIGCKQNSVTDATERLPSEPDAEAPVAVVRLAARGDGQDEQGRFWAGAVPGDRIAADGRILPGPHRAEPPCRHFGACGGCRLQHVAEPLLAGFCRDRVLEPLTRLGIAPAVVAPVHLSPPHSRRRASLRAVRRDGGLVLGYSPEGGHALVDLAHCPVMHPQLEALLPGIRALLAGLLPPRGIAGVALTLTDTGVDCLITNLSADRLPVATALADFAARAGLARLSVEGPLGVETVALAHSPQLVMGGAAVVVPPAAFLQATADGEAALVAAVRTAIGGARRVADLFAGLGTFALPISEGAQVHAVDAAGPALAALERAARAAARPVTTEHRDLFRRPLTAAELAPFDAIVIDPPRAGAIAQTDAIAASRVARVAAVSCNPATFARDAERLVAAGFRLERLWPVGQFRWSAHVELVAAFARPARR